MTKRGCSVLTLLFLTAVMMLDPFSASAQQFVSIDAPSSISTYTGGINNLGQIVGGYYDGAGVQHGYSLTNGTFTTIDFPGAIATGCSAVNNLGEIVGSYTDSANASHGFSLINGVFTTIDDPSFSLGTFPSQISDLGMIAGTGQDAQGFYHGFTLTSGVFKTLDYPGASNTFVDDMSFNGAEIIGAYILPAFSTGEYQGFTLVNGVYASVTFPESFNTQLNGVTTVGSLAGTYTLPNQQNQHPFTLSANTYRTEDFPGAVSSGAANMNDLGQIVGGYTDQSNVSHGYLMTSGPYFYVANLLGNNVSVIDVTTGLMVGTVTVGSGPFEAAVSPSGQQVYVTNNGSNSVSVISTATNTVTATIPVQSFPLGVAFTPDGTAAYVANYGSNSVSVINTSTQTVTSTVSVGRNPQAVAMAVTSLGTFAYVPNAFDNTVSVIAVGPNPTVVATISVGTTPEWAKAAPNSSVVYVENGGSSNVSVISVATNTVTATIPVGTDPGAAAFSPDSSTAYVTNLRSNTVSVIDTASNTVINTLSGFSSPTDVELSTDGSAAYVVNNGSNSVSVIATATETMAGTIAVGSGPIGIGIGAAPPTTLQITQPLSPTQPNTFTFPTTNYVVQYPSGTTFSGVNMTTAAVEMTQAQFSARVAGTQFASSTCIIAGGTGGNCVDYEITCSDNNGNQISCPSESTPTIAVQTSFSTSQSIINPGFLTTPIGQNNWTNIFSGYSDPTVKGKTSGFGTPAAASSLGGEFVPVDLGVTNPQGLANVQVVSPKFPAHYQRGGPIPVVIRLTSVATGQPITNGHASISVVMIADGKGNPTNRTMFSKLNAFTHASIIGEYKFTLNTSAYPAGTYQVTIYGDSFPATQGQFSIAQ